METKINKALRHLFYINSYGQTDGSGIMWMDKTGNTDYLKAPLPSPVFIDLKAFDSIKNNLASKKFVAGHTRYSTVGKNSWENSHPFEFGNFLGIQNGTISNSHKTLVYTKVSPCEVDSASVFWAFNEQGVKTTLDRYEGEGVFMFLNKEQKSFNIVKNNYRTLFKAKISKYNAYLIATDEFALDYVAERNGIDLDYVLPVDDDTLISYNMDNTVTKEPMEVPPPSIKSFVKYYYGGTVNTKSKSVEPKKAIVVNSKPYDHSTTKEVVDSSQKTDPIPYISSRKRSDIDYYIQDCDICMNPIMSLSVAYADDPDPLKCTHVACQHCQKDLEEFTGNKVYPIDFGDIL